MPASPRELGSRPACAVSLPAPPALTTRHSCFRNMSGPVPAPGSALAGPPAWEAMLPGLHEASLPHRPAKGASPGGRHPASSLDAVLPAISPSHPTLPPSYPPPTGHSNAAPAGGCSLASAAGGPRPVLLLFTGSPVPRGGHGPGSHSASSQAWVLGAPPLWEEGPGRTPARFGNLSGSLCSHSVHVPKAKPHQVCLHNVPPTRSPAASHWFHLSLSPSSSSLGYMVVTAAHRSVLSDFPSRHHKEMGSSSGKPLLPSQAPGPQEMTEKISNTQTESCMVCPLLCLLASSRATFLRVEVSAGSEGSTNRERHLQALATLLRKTQPGSLAARCASTAPHPSPAARPPQGSSSSRSRGQGCARSSLCAWHSARLAQRTPGRETRA